MVVVVQNKCGYSRLITRTAQEVQEIVEPWRGSNAPVCKDYCNRHGDPSCPHHGDAERPALCDSFEFKAPDDPEGETEFFANDAKSVLGESVNFPGK